MTAETLKPFITPTTAVNAFPAKQSSVKHSKRNAKELVPIGFSLIALLLVAAIFSLTIWQTTRVGQLENDLKSLRQEVDSLRQRLGINYLEDLAEFEKEYTNALIHDPGKLDDLEGEEDDADEDTDGDEDVDGTTDWDEDEDDEDDERSNYDDYLDLVRKETDAIQATAKNRTTESESADATSSSASNDDNVFVDFTSYNESKKKKERKARSIATVRNEVQSNDVSQNQNQTRINHLLKDAGAASESPMLRHPRRHRLRVRQGRERVLVRKAKSVDYNVGTLTAAAHFHLNRKVPHHNAPIQLESHQGDMYIGHAPASSDNQWQQHFTVNNGVLTVHQAGLYYVYAQICYNNSHDQNGFIIFHGQNAFLQCLNTVPTNMPQKVHTCHTSGLIQLQEQESIHLRDIHRDRNVMLRDANNRSYFGIIKI